MSISNRININTINSFVKGASYAVRGPIVARSQELSSKLAEPGNNLPFKKIISCNIGNPHALNQKSISFVRDVISIVLNPTLLDRVTFPEDVVKRATEYIRCTPEIGAYTESQGLLKVREEISSFLKKRDGYDANPNNLFLTNGASDGVRLCMQSLIRDPSSGFRDGVLTPIPQYPLYSALGTLLQSALVPYYLNEAAGWACSANDLAESLAKAEIDGISTRALVVINPGNPTGQVLSEDNMQDIVSFCVEKGICLMADEVYQENVWKPGAKFTSFRKVAMDMGAIKGADGLQLISFHSISKVGC